MRVHESAIQAEQKYWHENEIKLALVNTPNTGPNGTRYFQLPRAFDFYGSVKCHFKLVVVIFAKHTLEGLLKEGGVETVRHDHMSTERTIQTTIMVGIT